MDELTFANNLLRQFGELQTQSPKCHYCGKLVKDEEMATGLDFVAHEECYENDKAIGEF